MVDKLSADNMLDVLSACLLADEEGIQGVSLREGFKDPFPQWNLLEYKELS
ncbi:MAG: hypothetical protein OXJ52_05515 [Oligoflexia bacterium]|nr:hypothetical protein [Oligoflexia bacterium]